MHASTASRLGLLPDTRECHGQLTGPVGCTYPGLVDTMDVQELAATLQSVSQEKEKVEQRNAVLEKIVTMQIPPEPSVSSPRYSL